MKIHQRFHKTPLCYIILSQLNPVNVVISCFYDSKFSLFIVLRSTPVFSKSSESFVELPGSKWATHLTNIIFLCYSNNMYGSIDNYAGCYALFAQPPISSILPCDSRHKLQLCTFLFLIPCLNSLISLQGRSESIKCVRESFMPAFHSFSLLLCLSI
jgi:hypothetical protein